jgi:peroxiredoxin
MTDTTQLHPGDSFPELTVALPGGRSLQLPGSLAGHFGVVLFYRGSWCPYCNAQLSAFQRSHDAWPPSASRPSRCPWTTRPPRRT